MSSLLLPQEHRLGTLQRLSQRSPRLAVPKLPCATGLALRQVDFEYQRPAVGLPTASTIGNHHSLDEAQQACPLLPLRMVARSNTALSELQHSPYRFHRGSNTRWRQTLGFSLPYQRPHRGDSFPPDPEPLI